MFALSRGIFLFSIISPQISVTNICFLSILIAQRKVCSSTQTKKIEKFSTNYIQFKDLAIHQQKLKEWQENYDVPKRPSITSEKIQFYGKKFPHLKTKWAELLEQIKTLPAEEVAKNDEIIKNSAEQKTQIFQKRMEEYQNKYLVKVGNMTAQAMFFSTIQFNDLKSLWAKYNELSEEEKQKYQQLANEENQRKDAKLEKIAQQYGLSLEEFKKEVRKIIKESRKKNEESSSSSSDDEKTQSYKKDSKN